MGRVFMIGEDECRKMGTDAVIDSDGNRIPTLLKLENSHTKQPLFVSDIAAGYHHSIFLVSVARDSFHVWGCGSNSHGEIGSGIGTDLLPTHMKEYDNKEVIKVRCGYYSTILITRNGEVFIRGMQTPSPNALEVIKNEFIVEAASGYGYHMFITNGGKVYVYVKV